MPVRATVSDFGPQLLAKVLEANETQEQSLQLVFHYADQKGLPLLDLSDLRALLTFLDSDAGKAELEGIGGLASSTVGVLLRALVGLETGGGDEFFGEPQLDIADLHAHRARRPRRDLVPRAARRPGQAEAVLDGAHVAARRAVRAAPGGRRPATSPSSSSSSTRRTCSSTARRRRSSSPSTQTVRLIRSKGVGVFFVTQTPKDVPGDVLGQLGNRVQHALRAFTPDDAKALKATVTTFPKSEFYDLEELLTPLGIGEAAVTMLSERACRRRSCTRGCGRRRRAWARPTTSTAAAKASPLFAKYGTRVDAESAREKLAARLAQAEEPTPEPKPRPSPSPERPRKAPRRSGGPDAIGDSSGPGRARNSERRPCGACSEC